MSGAAFILASRLGSLGPRLALRREPQEKMLAIGVGLDGADAQEEAEASRGELAAFGEAGGSPGPAVGCRGHEDSALDMVATVPAAVAACPVRRPERVRT